MKTPVLNSCMSDVDAAFLYLERKEIPLHIACVSVFEEPIPFDKFVANIESKLHLLPRYRQVVAQAPFNLSHPTWKDDVNFDIRRHIFRVRLSRPGGEAELEALAGRILGEPLDRTKPLWAIHVVDGLKGGRGGLILRVHHALADGIAGVEILNTMLDATPEGGRPTRKPRPHLPSAHTTERSWLETAGATLSGALEGLISAEAGLLAAAGMLKDNAGAMLGAVPDLLMPVQRLPFNRACGGDRKFCWAEMNFTDVQAVRAAAGGTANDVILAVLTRALARYVRLHGETVANRLVRVVCPVSVRTAVQGESLGNRITFLPVMLPLDVRSPLRNLQEVSARMEAAKIGGGAGIVELLARWIGAFPPPLQSLFWSGIPLIPLPVPLLNIICTNIPGSPAPLYAVGKRMLTLYPHVPTGYDLGIGCAVYSYDGRLFFGLTADAKAAPDAGRLRDFLLVSFDELCRAAGVKKARRRARTTARRKAPPKRSAPPRTALKPAPATQPAAAPVPEPVPGTPAVMTAPPLAESARSGQ